MLALADAQHDLSVYIRPEDVACAVPKDPANCVIAQAIKRITGATRVEVHRSIARVDLPLGDDVWQPTRFRIREGDQRRIKTYDRTTEWPEEGQRFVTLKATAGTRSSLDAKSKYNRSYGQRVAVPQRRPKSNPDPDVRQFDRTRTGTSAKEE